MEVKETKKGIILSVHVKPSSRRNSISLDNGILVEVKEPPQQNRANILTIKIMAKTLGVASASISIMHGSTSDLKTLLIKGLSKQEVEGRISAIKNEALARKLERH
jgi:uncharacterized protein (TIGR00251 family)